MTKIEMENLIENKHVTHLVFGSRDIVCEFEWTESPTVMGSY